MNQGWRYENYIQPSQVGQTVLEFYRQFTHSTEQEWRSRILEGKIQLDGQGTTPDTRLQKNQHLVYHRPPWKEPSVPLDFSILYEDADLWVINKPSGLPVLPGGNFLEHTVLGQLRLRYPQDRLVPIHRLGRGTSGLLLLARSPQARTSLSQQMRDRKMTKRYRTLVGPGISNDSFYITQPIGRCPYPRLGYLYCASPSGKAAESRCQVVKRTSDSTLVDVEILTGRPHQIRIHLAYHGYPLQGDPLYAIGGQPVELKGNSDPIPSDCGYTLHAYHLKFQHPASHQLVKIDAPLPDRLKI